MNCWCYSLDLTAAHDEGEIGGCEAKYEARRAVSGECRIVPIEQQFDVLEGEGRERGDPRAKS